MSVFFKKKKKREEKKRMEQGRKEERENGRDGRTEEGRERREGKSKCTSVNLPRGSRVWPCPASFGKNHLFGKQEVVSRGVGRRNDRTEWHSRELLAVVNLEWLKFFQVAT